MLNGETHVPQIRHLTTLAGYVHWQLTGRQVLGVGEASGMFPVNSATGTFDARMLALYDARIAPRRLPWRLEDILPTVLQAGDEAGTLTPAGALLLDPTGTLRPGIPLCPPEGDAGTGMTATNSVAPRTGNVSAGTSVFSMVVLERPLSRVYPEIDMVTTPTGAPVAMVHCNNCTSDINAWAGLFRQFAAACGLELDADRLYTTLFRAALEGAPDGGGLMSYSLDSGEPVAGLDEGRPLFLRRPGQALNLGDFMRTQLMAALATLKLGNDLLLSEGVQIDALYGHGGYFKTPVVGQRMLAAALNAPVTVMETAGEGGAWGMALLAGFALWRRDGQRLEDYLAGQVFADMQGSRLEPDAADVAGFDAFLARFRQGLPVERAAAEHL